MKWRIRDWIYRNTAWLVKLNQRITGRKHYIPMWRWKMLQWCYRNRWHF